VPGRAPRERCRSLSYREFSRNLPSSVLQLSDPFQFHYRIKVPFCCPLYPVELFPTKPSLKTPARVFSFPILFAGSARDEFMAVPFPCQKFIPEPGFFFFDFFFQMLVAQVADRPRKGYLVMRTCRAQTPRVSREFELPSFFFFSGPWLLSGTERRLGPLGRFSLRWYPFGAGFVFPAMVQGAGAFSSFFFSPRLVKQFLSFPHLFSYHQVCGADVSGVLRKATKKLRRQPLLRNRATNLSFSLRLAFLRTPFFSLVEISTLESVFEMLRTARAPLSQGDALFFLSHFPRSAPEMPACPLLTPYFLHPFYAGSSRSGNVTE